MSVFIFYRPLKVSLKRPLSVGGEGGEGGEAKIPRLQVKPLGRQERMSATPSLSDGGSERWGEGR